MAALPSTFPAAEEFAADWRDLGMVMLQRGWLSANQLVFARRGDVPPSVIDTGFSAHAPQTVALVAQALAGDRLERVVNTHLHSDHCGGNAALHERWNVQTWVPAPSLQAVRQWDEAALSYRLTDQPCPRYTAEHALVPGSTLPLGAAAWEIHAAPGHDMDAVLFFEPQTRTLVSGDALWEERLAIIFPDLFGKDGFRAARATLDLIERLAPRQVVPGHGRAFGDVAAALAASRQRLAAFERDPVRHAQHAVRALLMFHLLEVRSATPEHLVHWMTNTPICRVAARRAAVAAGTEANWASTQLRRLLDDGVLESRGDAIAVPAEAH